MADNFPQAKKKGNDPDKLPLQMRQPQVCRGVFSETVPNQDTSLPLTTTSSPVWLHVGALEMILQVHHQNIAISLHTLKIVIV